MLSISQFSYASCFSRSVAISAKFTFEVCAAI